MAHDRQRQVFPRPSCSEGPQPARAAWMGGRLTAGDGRRASASVGRFPRQRAAASGATSPDHGGPSRPHDEKSCEQSSERRRIAGSRRRWLLVREKGRERETAAVAVDGGEEIALRQRGSVGAPDRGIAGMKVGREHSSLQCRRAEGFEGSATTALTDNDGAERAGGLGRGRAGKERKQRTTGGGPSRPRPLGGGKRARGPQIKAESILISMI